MPNKEIKKTNDSSEQSFFHRASFLLYLFIVSGIFIFMIRQFLLILFMAAVFTGLTFPLYCLMTKRFKNKALASALTLLSITLILIIPVIAISLAAYREALNLFQQVDIHQLKTQVESIVNSFSHRFPALMQRINAQDISGMAVSALQNALQYILQNGASFSVSIANQIANFFLMLFMMFYFYMDGEKILLRLIRLSPLKDDYEKVLLQKFLTASKATLKGVLVIGAIQGFTGTLLFLCVGVGSPVFLGVLMVFASIIPAVGCALVWLPVALVLLFQGHVITGMIVLLAGIFIIGTVDNLLRPFVVGKDMQIHDLAVLVSTLGGIGLFGLPGFIIGPLIASLFFSIWEIYEEVFARELYLNAIPTTKNTQE